MLHIIRKEEQPTATWSGGTTTQLWISPRSAQYQNRDFDFRISTATIDVEESVFSDLTGYKRYLMSLTEPLILYQNADLPYTLEPLTCYSFNGADTMKSIGKARDFNVMVKPTFSADLEVVTLKNNTMRSITAEKFALYCLSGSITVQGSTHTQTLHKHDFAFAEAEDLSIHTHEGASFILISIQ